MNETKFNIAISYARKDEDFAKKIATALKGLKVFLDIEQYDLLVCKFLHEILYDVFYNLSDFALMLISNQYLERNHTLWEARTIIAKSTSVPGRYFIVVDQDVDIEKVRNLLCINDNYLFCSKDFAENDFESFINILKKRILECGTYEK